MADNLKMATDAATYRPLNPPEEVVVRENASGVPIRIGRGSGAILSVEDRWRIDDEWWRREPVSRMYYLIRLDSGSRLTVYKDLIKGRWYKQRVGSE